MDATVGMGCGKIKYETKAEATKAMLLVVRRKPKMHGANVYKCHHCGFYHWGHKAIWPTRKL